MLLAVEGGGFFSASASGYSKFLSLLLFGRKNEERPMRVLPWSQYQLVVEEVDSDLQLAPKKNRVFRGCAFLICFGHPSKGLNGTSPPNVGPVNQSKPSLDPAYTSEKNGDSSTSNAGTENGRKVFIKSSIKKPTTDSSVTKGDESLNVAITVVERDVGNAAVRKVQWTDACGKELTEIREFEPSERGASDDEAECEGNRRCTCIIQ